MAALHRIRLALPSEDTLSNEQVSNKYGNKIGRILKEVWGGCDGHDPTAYNFRKMYAIASFKAVGEPAGVGLV
jgi:hypothetical protein